MNIAGFHHVTAIAGDPQRNLDFYTGVLGLRLVKLTVNFDDPGSYHLYYADYAGTPGTIVTFFSWPGGSKGRQGAGQAIDLRFQVPKASVDYWAQRVGGTPDPERVLRFQDPDGLSLSLEFSGSGDGHAIERVSAVTLASHSPEATGNLLEKSFGYAGEAGALRFRSPNDSVELLPHARGASGSMGVGTVHHVAFRAEDDERQLAWQQKLMREGLSVTQVMDRDYFHSIYFREPGGVLFEIATDPPGFTADEPLEQLGSSLKLPAWLEPRRAQIEQHLPLLRLPV